MTENRMFEFELTFTLPKNEQHDMTTIVEKIYGAVPEDDPVVGLGKKGQIGVMLELDGDNPLHIMLSAAKRILAVLPEGAEVHEFHPDLVSLQQVATQLKTTRQNLRLKDLPDPIYGGLYRLSEVSRVLISAYSAGKKTKRQKVDIDGSISWLSSSAAAQKLNGLMAAGLLDGKSLELRIPEAFLEQAA